MPHEVLYGSLYLDRGERWPKVVEQIEAFEAQAQKPNVAIHGFYFDVLYGRTQVKMAADFVERIKALATKALPGVEISVTATRAQSPSHDPRVGVR
jgi:hypothetical protein